jgi:hypothetical protein
MTFLELRDKLNELPPEVLNRPAIAVYRDERNNVYQDFNVSELFAGRICRMNMYMEFAEIKLQSKDTEEDRVNES